MPRFHLGHKMGNHHPRNHRSLQSKGSEERGTTVVKDKISNEGMHTCRWKEKLTMVDSLQQLHVTAPKT